MTLTKAKLAIVVHEKLRVKKGDALDIVEAFFEEICTHLERNESVQLSGFGHFHICDKSPRPGRNLSTGEEVTISARRVVSFHLGPKLKEKVIRSCTDIEV